MGSVPPSFDEYKDLARLADLVARQSYRHGLIHGIGIMGILVMLAFLAGQWL